MEKRNGKIHFVQLLTEPPAGPGFPRLYGANVSNGTLVVTFLRFASGAATGITFIPGKSDVFELCERLATGE